MIVRPDRQIIKKEKLERNKLNNIKSADAMFGNLCYENQNIILQRERLKNEEIVNVVKVTAEIIAAKKAEMQKIIDTKVIILRDKKFKKKELDKKFKEIRGGKPQTKFIETINIKIPLYSVGNHSGTNLRVKSQHEPGLIKSNRP